MSDVSSQIIEILSTVAEDKIAGVLDEALSLCDPAVRQQVVRGADLATRRSAFIAGREPKLAIDEILRTMPSAKCKALIEELAASKGVQVGGGGDIPLSTEQHEDLRRKVTALSQPLASLGGAAASNREIARKLSEIMGALTQGAEDVSGAQKDLETRREDIAGSLAALKHGQSAAGSSSVPAPAAPTSSSGSSAPLIPDRRKRAHSETTEDEDGDEEFDDCAPAPPVRSSILGSLKAKGAAARR